MNNYLKVIAGMLIIGFVLVNIVTCSEAFITVLNMTPAERAAF